MQSRKRAGRMTSQALSLGGAVALAASAAIDFDAASAAGEERVASAFVNWESAQVHPLDMTPDGARLLAVNTADNRLEVFTLGPGGPAHAASIPVGLDPVSVCARTNSEAWVVNTISDTVSVVDLNSGNVIATLKTGDEPGDVVFAGSPQRAFVSCSQTDSVQVFDPANLSAPPVSLVIDGQTPRAMSTSGDGARVFVAVCESGNGTTILGGGSTMNNGFPPNAVSDPLGPYGGQNPPPNNGTQFRPTINPALPAPPRVGLIVRRNSAGQWMDDNSRDWTSLVSGAQASRSGRPPGWTLPDRDLAIIDANGLTVSYASGLMNICMALAVNPATQRVTVVGTDAMNHVRFEPVVNGRFLRVNMGTVDPAAPGSPTVVDLNPHLTYTSDIPFAPIPQSERDKSLGDPRAIVWNSAGTRGYVAGMGSNNVAVIDSAGARAGLAPAVDVPEGPTGLVIDEARGFLYVLSKFAGAVSTISLASETVTATAPLFDPTPQAIRVGRKHLYDTHKNSGLGHIACASCHVDARMDRLAWDLGDPAGQMRTFDQNCPAGGCQNWHPMKGPMTTQTLQDIIGKEPLHWRGDRFGLEEFNGAFASLQGDDAVLTPTEMQEYEDFLATIHFPPNPFRNFDNSLPTSLPLPGHFTTGRFAPAGAPLPSGNAVQGLNSYRTGFLDGVQCVTCHTLPTGLGPDGTIVGGSFQPLPPGPNGERHHALVSQDGSTNVSIKIPQLRNQYQKAGFNTTQTSNTAGFGYLHDGSVDSIERFVNEPVFGVTSDQMTANLVAFMLAFSGSDLPMGSPSSLLEPPGPTGRDTHAAVGMQTTLVTVAPPPPQLALIDAMIAQADLGRIGVVVKGRQSGVQRGWAYIGGATFQSDRAMQTISTAALKTSAATTAELTFTAVPFGSQTRIGIDRDLDGYFDRDELDAGSDPADPASVPGAGDPADLNGDGVVNSADLALLLGSWGPCSGACPADLNHDDQVSSTDLALMLGSWT